MVEAYIYLRFVSEIMALNILKLVRLSLFTSLYYDTQIQFLYHTVNTDIVFLVSILRCLNYRIHLFLVHNPDHSFDTQNDDNCSKHQGNQPALPSGLENPTLIVQA